MDEAATPETPETATPAAPEPKGFGRFTKHIIIGSIIGGVLSAIPILHFLNCMFCILNVGGIVIALHLYLNANPEDKLTSGEAAGFGALAGVGAGIIASIIFIVTMWALGAKLAILMASIPGSARLGSITSAGLGAGIVRGIIRAFFRIALFTGFGALGAFLAMKLFYKDRSR